MTKKPIGCKNEFMTNFCAFCDFNFENPCCTDYVECWNLTKFYSENNK